MRAKCKISFLCSALWYRVAKLSTPSANRRKWGPVGWLQLVVTRGHETVGLERQVNGQCSWRDNRRYHGFDRQGKRNQQETRRSSIKDQQE